MHSVRIVQLHMSGNSNNYDYVDNNQYEHNYNFYNDNNRNDNEHDNNNHDNLNKYDNYNTSRMWQQNT